jgi:hypothetical protein
MPDPFAIEVDAFYNTIVLRSPDVYEPLAPDWFPTEPQFVTGGPGRLVIHTGGRGLVRVTVTSTETPAPPLTDSLLTVWEDIRSPSRATNSASTDSQARYRIQFPIRGQAHAECECLHGDGLSTGTPTGHRRPNRRYDSTSNSGRSNSAARTSSCTETGLPEIVAGNISLHSAVLLRTLLPDPVVFCAEVGREVRVVDIPARAADAAFRGP